MPTAYQTLGQFLQEMPPSTPPNPDDINVIAMRCESYYIFNMLWETWVQWINLKATFPKTFLVQKSLYFLLNFVCGIEKKLPAHDRAILPRGSFKIVQLFSESQGVY